VDPKILGGFIFEIDDYRLDASVATQFEKIKKQFIEKNKRIV
jgi:F-type H+-transporting ATPase subunit delta